ncbi:hypothetical protein V8C26DRAFT_173509 [Trichoderma gracile]
MAPSVVVVSQALSRPQGRVHQSLPRGLHAQFSRCPRSAPRLAGDSASLLERFSKRMCLLNSVIGQEESPSLAGTFGSLLRCLIRRRSAMDNIKQTTSPGWTSLSGDQARKRSPVFGGGCRSGSLSVRDAADLRTDDGSILDMRNRPMKTELESVLTVSNARGNAKAYSSCIGLVTGSSFESGKCL